MGHMPITCMHLTSNSYNHVQCVVDCNEVLEMPDKRKNLVVKVKCGGNAYNANRIW